MADRVLTVVFAGDASKAVAATKAVSTGLEKTTATAGQFAHKTRYASAIAAGGLFYAASAASDLNEVIDFSRVVFGKSADGMEEWADQALETMGIARVTALGAANDFGIFLTKMGKTKEEAASLSQELVQLAVDMSSAKDVPLQESLDAIRSGLAGESEPLRRFGVDLRDASLQAYALEAGIIDTLRQLTAQEKQLAVVGRLFQDTAVFQGNYADTADSAANSQRRAAEAAKDSAATLGEALAPILAQGAQLLEKLASGFEKLPEPAQTATVAVIGLVAVMSPLSKAVELGGKIWLAYRAHQAAATVATVAQSAALEAQVGASVGATLATRSYTTTTRIATIATWGWRTALLALPWVAVTAGINIAGQAADDFLDKRTPEDSWLNTLGEKLNVFDNFWSKLNPFDGLMPEGSEASKKLTEIAGAAETVGTAVAAAFETVGLRAGAMGDDVDDLHKKTKRFAGMTGKEFREWRVDTVGNFNSVEGSLEALADKHNVTAERIRQTFAKQLTSLGDYRGNWEKLIKRGLPDSLAKQLQEMGVEGASIVAALAQANKSEFKEIIGQWQQAQRESRATSKVINQSFAVDAASALQSAINKATSFADVLRAIRENSDLRVNVVYTSDVPTGPPPGGGGGGGQDPSSGQSGGPGSSRRGDAQAQTSIVVHAGHGVSRAEVKRWVAEGVREADRQGARVSRTNLRFDN